MANYPCSSIGTCACWASEVAATSAFSLLGLRLFKPDINDQDLNTPLITAVVAKTLSIISYYVSNAAGDAVDSHPNPVLDNKFPGVFAVITGLCAKALSRTRFALSDSVLTLASTVTQIVKGWLLQDNTVEMMCPRPPPPSPNATQFNRDRESWAAVAGALAGYFSSVGRSITFVAGVDLISGEFREFNPTQANSFLKTRAAYFIPTVLIPTIVSQKLGDPFEAFYRVLSGSFSGYPIALGLITGSLMKRFKWDSDEKYPLSLFYSIFLPVVESGICKWYRYRSE